MSWPARFFDPPALPPYHHRLDSLFLETFPDFEVVSLKRTDDFLSVFLARLSSLIAILVERSRFLSPLFRGLPLFFFSRTDRLVALSSESTFFSGFFGPCPWVLSPPAREN